MTRLMRGTRLMRQVLTRAALTGLLAVATLAVSDPASAQRAGTPRVVEETELDRETRAVAAQLRCVVCQGLSIEDSPSQLAQEMRAVVREQLEQGKSPAEVKQYFIAKYGEWVLLQPEPKGFNLVVYVMPVLMLLGGGVFVYVTARRMTRAGEAGAAIVDDARREEETRTVL